ncbi:MAG: FAD-dependent oxidoreductase, partial [Clostridiales bacterium]|nr:FAD-dependent oxidoreductase [Clostridiales bacterium]
MIIEKERKIPVIDTFDLVVVGGGVAGVAAALAAARNNVSVCLIEKENMLGGLAT